MGERKASVWVGRVRENERPGCSESEDKRRSARRGFLFACLRFPEGGFSFLGAGCNVEEVVNFDISVCRDALPPFTLCSRVWGTKGGASFSAAGGLETGEQRTRAEGGWRGPLAGHWTDLVVLVGNRGLVVAALGGRRWRVYGGPWAWVWASRGLGGRTVHCARGEGRRADQLAAVTHRALGPWWHQPVHLWSFRRAGSILSGAGGYGMFGGTL